MTLEPAAHLPKVMLVGPFPPTKGGVTTFMLNLAGSKLSTRFAFIPFTTARPPKRNTVDNYGYAAVLRGGPARVLAGAAITLGHILTFPFAAARVDIVQVQASDYQVFWESAAYVWLAKRLRKPVVLRIGGAFDSFFAGSPPWVQGLIVRVLNQADWLIAQSEFAKGFLVQAGRLGPVVVVPNWSRASALDGTQRPVRAEPLFLFVAGNEARRKGVEDVLGAAERLQQRGAAARFHLLACPPVLQQRIEALALANIIRVDGFIDNAEVLSAMRAADALLLPSHGEGFPNTLVEAMGCGLPAIATPVGAGAEILRDGGGILVPVGDAEALATAIEALTSDAAQRAAMGRDALKRVREAYVEDAVLPPLGEVYDNLLGIKR